MMVLTGAVYNLCIFIIICVFVCVFVSWRAKAVNELLNHTIDQPFLPDTRWDRGQLNGLFGDSH